jgi:hypothetical protein
MISRSLLQMLTELDFKTVLNGCNHRVTKINSIKQPMAVAPHIGHLCDSDFSVLMDPGQRTLPFFGLLDSEVRCARRVDIDSSKRPACII